jgi:hypothetical protein
VVRPEGFEPPAYWSVASHDGDDLLECPFCYRGFYDRGDYEAHVRTCDMPGMTVAFWSIVEQFTVPSA